MKIGVFDSGIGGLWILKNLKEHIKYVDYVFFADQNHVPYGSRNVDEIRVFSEVIVRFLIDKGCKIIVIACNTASASSLKYLREKFPEVLFVGMEPAIKPAVETTHTNKVGVLATPATFQGELYNSVVERFAHDTEIFKDTCSGLVEKIEEGDFQGQETRNILKKALSPMLDNGIDTVVLGCTHYPFVIPLIKEIVGENINVIDPTYAIVKRVESLIEDKYKNDKESGIAEIFTSGDKNKLNNFLKNFFENDLLSEKVDWVDDLKLNY